MSDSAEILWVEIHRAPNRAEAGQYALVIVAIGIDCQIGRRGDGFGIFVAATDVERARNELAAYIRDNQTFSPPPLPQRPLRETVAGTIVYCCVLFFIFGAADHEIFSGNWLLAGNASAGLIVEGEWWRTITALTLHIDLAHLFSNVVAGAFLGILLARVLGDGLAWLLILMAGAIGNVGNAMIQPAEHAAIGASTAVFGALGLLAVLMSKYRESAWTKGARRWVPIAAGVMLLAFLGVQGERIDVGGHISGFIAGCLLGAGALAIGEVAVRQLRNAQFLFAALALVVLIAAWVIALG